MNFKKLLEAFDKMLNKNNISTILIIALVGILIMIGVSFFKDTTSTNTIAQTNKVNIATQATGGSEVAAIQNYENTKKQELISILQEIQGVGKVDAVLSIESTSEQVPAVNNNISDSQTDEKDTSGGTRKTVTNSNGNNIVITNGDNGTTSPLILKTYLPKIAGVVVTAQGAGSNIVNLQISKAVSILFNIPESKVNVLIMK